MRNILLFAAAFCGLTSFAATTEVATFSSLEDGTKVGDYTVNGNCISGGTAWTYSEYITVIVKYSGLPSSGQQAIVTLHQANHDDKAGVIANSSKVHGLWEGGEYGSDGSSLDASGIIVFVYAPNQSAKTGTKVYNAEGDSILDVPGLRASSGSVGDTINFGAKHDGTSMKLSGFSVDALQILKGAAAASEITTLVAAFEEAIKPVADVISVNVQQDNICTQGTIQSGSIYKTLAGDILGSEWGVINAPGGSRDANTASGSVTIKGATVSIYSWAGSNWSFINDTDKGAQGETQAASEYAYLNVFGSNRDRTKNDGWIGATKVPYEKYDVYIYFAGGLAGGNASSANGKFPGVRVASGYSAEGFDNTMYYKVAEDGTLDLNISSATQDDSALMWGSRSASSTPLLGSNVIKICGCTGDFKMFYAAWDSGPAAIQIVEVMTDATKAELSYEGDVKVSEINNDLKTTDNKAEVTLQSGATIYFDAALTVPTKLICEGSITLSAAEKPDLTKLVLSGVTGGVVRTWMTETEKKGIGFNFASKRGPVTTAALVAEAAWYDNNDGGSDDEGKNGTNVAMSSDSLTTITWTSNNTYDDDANSNTHGANSSASMVRGYLDDSQGVSITVKNVPFEEYSLIIYASTDNGDALSYKTVNNKDYTANGDSDVAIEGTDSWGKQQSSGEGIAYGRNAIRIVGLKGSTLTINSQRRDADTKKIRGCISAIQIVPYSTFVKPSATIASVESKCSEDYKSNTITGTIADYVANSWTGDMTSRVVVNSTVYASEAIVNNAFSIEVSGLSRENVYRTVLEIGYTEKGVFTAIATQPIALYQGERKFVWIASPFVIQEKTSINDANGLTIADPFDDPDYVDLCDSEYTVSISASEAVDATADAALVGNEQGGIRIAEVNGALKLQVIDNGAWVDFAAAAVDTTYTMTVKFHYQKEQEGETARTSVTYTLDKTSKEATNKTDKLKVTEIFVSDGTNLSDDLLGACQLDKAVIVDIELEPGDEQVGIVAKDDEEAQEIVSKLKVGISEAVAEVLTTAEAQNAYRAYFKIVAVKTADGSYTAKVVFAEGVEDDIEKDIAAAIDDVVDSFNTGADVTMTAKPGLYYGVKRGDSLGDMNTVETELATSDKVTIKITKPDTSKSHFYRIIVSPTPAKEQ